MNLIHLPLEPYKARYTEQLQAWEQRAFAARFDKIITLDGKEPGRKSETVIQSGKVLDSRNRPKWAMRQMIQLMDMQYPKLGKIYFSDFFHPGIEALPYCGSDFQAYAFCWAQTFDQYDFTFDMHQWMRPYEVMGYSIFNKVFVACDELRELITACSPEFGLRTEVVGLPFDSDSVSKTLDGSYECPKYDVVFSSRMDAEKQPSFFLDLVRQMGLKAAICTGRPSLQGDDHQSIKLAEKMRDDGKLDIHANLTKGQYYSVLSNTHVQFNCALQDWVSFTLLEALTFGCVPLYPNFRAFPKTLNYSTDILYVPFELQDAADKLRALLSRSRNFSQSEPILAHHDNTLVRIADSMFLS